MENQISTYKIIRHIETNGYEYDDEISVWLKCSVDNQNHYNDLLTVWQITGDFPGRFTPDRNKAWLKIKEQINFRKEHNLLLRKFLRVAAAIVVVLLSAWFGRESGQWHQNLQYTEILSQAGQKTRVLLPDSSIVLLNGNSQLKYNQNFNQENRTIELKGEGYFEVRKNYRKQFIVKTSDVDIKVFGTVFNVKSHDNDQKIEIGLINGQIGIDRSRHEIARLDPGQLAVFDKQNSKLAIGKMDVNLVSAWTRDELIFEENSLEEVVKYIERWYNVDIKVDTALMDGELLTFKVKSESLSELLDLINLLKPIKYKIDGKHVFINKP